MKFDMGQAWNDATSMVSANKDVLAIVAGVFFFLPALALSILAPGTELEAAAGDPARLQAAFAAYFTNNWILFALYGIASWIGTLALFALLGRDPKPTVGEALSIAVKALLPYLAATIIVGVAVAVAAGLVGMIAGAAGSPAIGVVLALIVIGFFAFVSIRIVLVGPIMAIEEELNPIKALSRSWALVKGNTRYVFLFLFLVIIAVVVVSMVLGIVFALIGALLGATGALWVEAILGAVLGAGVTIMLLAIYAAIHQQLAGGATPKDLETFE